MPAQTAAAAALAADRRDTAARQAQIDVRLGRPPFPPPGRAQAAAYQAAYRAAKAAR